MKKYTKHLLTTSFLLWLIPLSFILAANDVLDIIDIIQEILSAVVPLIFSLAVIYFIWSSAQYILKEGDAKNEAKSHMIWGIVILFVMVSIWGLVAVLEDTFLL